MHLAAENYCVNVKSTQHKNQSILQLDMVLKAYTDISQFWNHGKLKQ